MSDLIRYDAETIENATASLYILKPEFHDNYEEATYTEYYDMGPHSEREVYMSAKLYTKVEAIEAFKRTGGDKIEYAIALPEFKTWAEKQKEINNDR